MSGIYAAALALAIGSIGCSDSPGRREFTPIPSTISQPAGTLVLDGPSSIEPGTSARFTATLVDPTGARRDVTRDALWSARGSGIVIVEPGVAAALEPGFARIFVSHGLAIADTTLTATPAGTFVVRGRISPLLVEAPGHVEIVEGRGAGRSADADDVGEYLLTGLAGPTRLRASMLAHDAADRAIVVDGTLNVDFTLERTRSPDASGPWRLSVTSAPECRFGVLEASAAIDLTRDPPPAAFTYSLVLPAYSSLAPLQAKIIGTAFSAELYWGDKDWFGTALGVPLGDSAEVRGSAYGDLSDNRIVGTLHGSFMDTRAQPHVACDGIHRFELRR